MAFDFDAIVIGSGFGGSVAACRLAENGNRVLVLERGRRWTPETLPRKPDDAWEWDSYHPERRNGWIDMRWFPKMAVVQGAAVGGGSHIYANVSVEARADVFDSGWPQEITHQGLKPHYATVGEMMDVQPLPEVGWTPRTHLMKEAAEAIGAPDQFERINLAVTFDPVLRYEDATPPPPTLEKARERTKTFTNKFGRQQGTCVYLGSCDLGCDVQAKNTLDLNYLAKAENDGADVRPLHLVTSVQPEGGGYRVNFDRLEDGRRRPDHASARVVIIAAGSLNTTELLLRCKDEFRTLPDISDSVGASWSSNGDFIAAMVSNRELSPTWGPTISSAIDFLGPNARNGQHMFMEDLGYADFITNLTFRKSRLRPFRNLQRTWLLRAIQRALHQKEPLANVMPWFAMGRDAANGHMTLRKRYFFFGQKRLQLHWNPNRSKPLFNEQKDLLNEMAQVTGGRGIEPPWWKLGKALFTPHPLGGCSLANTREEGVVDHRGEVFGYKNLYVLDGAIVPKALGLNPSKTIAALAERAMEIMVAEAT